MDGNSACDTLSYSYDDWAIHNIAVYMNKSDIAQDFLDRSQFYKNVFDNSTKFFCPKYSTNESFNCP
jgi:putative alpha-1,2-mannosidase